MEMSALKVYDILGKEIFTLVNKKQQVGKYEVSFNAKKLPSGVYFCQLNANKFTLTKKMLLLEWHILYYQNKNLWSREFPENKKVHCQSDKK